MVACSDIYCQEISVGNNPLPRSYCKAYFDYYPDSTGLVYNFNDKSIGKNITNWLWDFGDNTTSTDENPVHQFAQAGTYNVCLTISSQMKCHDTCSDTYCQEIYTGKYLPQNCSANFKICPTSTPHVYNIVNMAWGVRPIKYLWSWGDGTYDTAAYPTHTYDSTGFYTICLAVTDFNGCISSYCVSYSLKSNNILIKIKVIPNGKLSGINENNSNKSINYYSQVYPDPVNNYASIRIELNAQADIKLDVLNYVGQLVFSSVDKLNAG